MALPCTYRKSKCQLNHDQYTASTGRKCIQQDPESEQRPHSMISSKRKKGVLQAKDNQGWVLGSYLEGVQITTPEGPGAGY